VAWNGLTTVTESPSGADANPIYADDTKYLNLVAAEEFGATVEAYTYPDEFAVCDGSADLAAGVRIGQQNRKSFGLSYRTTIGNDVDGNDYGYKLHLVYGALAAPSEKGYATINDSPEAIAFSWELSTIPAAVTGKKPTSVLTIDSTKVSSQNLAALEDILYGTTGADPYLPLPDEVAAIFAGAAPSAVALSSIVPADGSSTALTTANVVLTFNNEIKSNAVVVTKADGTFVATTKSWDTAKKVLTVHPTTALSAGATYLVAIAGVVDIYNQALDAEVKDFTVAT
jgi:methionine-rich copper-binding protein CopC